MTRPCFRSTPRYRRADCEKWKMARSVISIVCLGSCDPCWSWWYGCTVGNVQIVTGSRGANAFGGNIGGSI